MECGQYHGLLDGFPEYQQAGQQQTAKNDGFPGQRFGSLSWPPSAIQRRSQQRSVNPVNCEKAIAARQPATEHSGMHRCRHREATNCWAARRNLQSRRCCLVVGLLKRKTKCPQDPPWSVYPPEWLERSGLCHREQRRLLHTDLNPDLSTVASVMALKQITTIDRQSANSPRKTRHNHNPALGKSTHDPRASTSHRLSQTVEKGNSALFRTIGFCFSTFIARAQP